MRVLALPFVLLPLCGCLVVPDFGNHSDRDVPLSRAMEASAAGSREAVPDPGESGGNGFALMPFGGGSSGDSGEANATGESSGMVDYDSREFFWQIPADVSWVVPLNGDWSTITRFSLTPFSVEDKRNFFGWYVGGGGVEFEEGSLPDAAVENAFFLETGFAYRRYFNDPHALVSPYATAAIAWQTLFWEYRSPVFTPEERITSDLLHGMTGYAAVGAAVWRRHWISAYAEVGLGGTMFVQKTGEGFENDVFDEFGYVSFKAGLTLKF
jgi:hypothetical protein